MERNVGNPRQSFDFSDMNEVGEQLRTVMVAAEEEARELEKDYVGTEFLLLGLAKIDPTAQELLAKIQREPTDHILETLRTYTETEVERGSSSTPRLESLPLTPIAKNIIENAYAMAQANNEKDVNPLYILSELFAGNEGVHMEVLKRAGVTPSEIQKCRDEIQNMIMKKN